MPGTHQRKTRPKKAENPARICGGERMRRRKNKKTTANKLHLNRPGEGKSRRRRALRPAGKKGTRRLLFFSRRPKSASTRLQKKQKLTGFLFALPAIAGMLVFFLIPFCVAILISFTNGVGSSTFVGLANYIGMVQNSAFQLAAFNTAKFIALAVPTLSLIHI